MRDIVKLDIDFFKYKGWIRVKDEFLHKFDIAEDAIVFSHYNINNLYIIMATDGWSPFRVKDGKLYGFRYKSFEIESEYHYFFEEFMPNNKDFFL